MPVNPFGILAGLATVGAEGASGALGGEVEGIQLKQKLASQDVLNNLRILESILKGQEVQRGTQPQYSIQGGRLVATPPVGAPTITALPELPETSGQVAQRREREALTSYYGKLAETAGEKTPTVNIHYERDAKGNLTRIVTRVHPVTGAVSEDRQALGPIGVPQRPPAASVPRETITKKTRITPRKPIKSDDVDKLNDALPQIVNELSAKPGFNVPGAWVVLPNGMRVRKEDIIAQAILQKLGIEATVQWQPKPTLLDKNAGRFRIIKAWEPEQREPIEESRVTGPPREQPPEGAQEEESGNQ